MGYEAGRGLGREGQGIIEPIKESSQRNRAGLGAARITELEAADVQWEQEEVCLCVCALGLGDIDFFCVSRYLRRVSRYTRYIGGIQLMEIKVTLKLN